MGQWENERPEVQGEEEEESRKLTQEASGCEYNNKLTVAVFVIIVVTLLLSFAVSLQFVIEYHQRKVKKEAQGALFQLSSKRDDHQNLRGRRAVSGEGGFFG